MKTFSRIICLLAFILSYQIAYALQPLAEDGRKPSKTTQGSDVIFKLIESIKFADGTEVRSIAKNDIESLRDLPVRLGENEGIDGVTLSKRKVGKIHVRTCREYDEARKKGYSPLSTFDITMAMFFKEPCGLLNALAKASLPRESFISDAEVGIVNLELLPFLMFPYLGETKSPQEAKRDSEMTYQQKIETGKLVVIEKNKHVLQIQGDDMVQSLREMVRADFNNDDIEDILLFEYHWVRKGTLRFGGILVLTRKSMNGKFKVLRPLDPKQSSPSGYWFNEQ